ncbi:MAG TPA: hypothetical protein VNO81_04275 [Candidatus Nitrosotenuis sp.]|jgi:hypothetical protein|nr:hypothetical protein [Candidatus Nitrosotenuis sp.]
MGWHDHPPQIATSVATPDIGTRILAYASDLGLSEEQRGQLLELMRRWREEYGSHLARIASLAEEVKTLVEVRPPRPAECYRKIDEHSSAINALERAYADAVARLTDLLGAEQCEAAERIYQVEKSTFPIRRPGVL